MKKTNHKLTTIEDIANVITEANYKTLMLDLANCFAYYLDVKKKNDGYKLKHINWKDDNTVGMTGVSLLDKTGKQIKKIKFPKGKK